MGKIIDVPRLLRDADAESVLNLCGIFGSDVRRSGDLIYFRCPFHLSRIGKADRKIGNCCIRRSTKKFICYSCGAHGGLIDLVEECTNSDFQEAARLIGDTCGGIDAYMEPDSDDLFNQVKFRKENAAFFQSIHLDAKSPSSTGNVANGCIVNEVYTKEEAFAYADRGYRIEKIGLDLDFDAPDPIRWLIIDPKPGISLGMLKREDPAAYDFLIKGKCQEFGMPDSSNRKAS